MEQGYKWVNRESFPNHGVQELGDRVLPKQSPEEEERNVGGLLDRVLERSDTAFVVFNDSSREMQLYGVPSNSTRYNLSSHSVIAIKRFSDTRHYFTYNLDVGRLFGGRGTFIRAAATRDNRSFEYGLEVVRSLWERLDSQTSSNRDKVGFLWRFPKSRFYDNLLIRLYRESRSNFLDLRARPNPTGRIFGEGQQEANLLKHSNLIGLSVDYVQSFARAMVSTGWDYGNRSYFLSWGCGFDKAVPLGNWMELEVSLNAAQVIGRNILKNDLLYRNTQHWPGSRSNNFVSPRLELGFKDYPYLSFLGLRPYLYAQGWAVLRRSLVGRLGAHLEFEYGLGLSTIGKSRLDLSLFRLSGEKQRGFAFGEVKLSF